MSAAHAAVPTRGAVTAELVRAAINDEAALVLTADGFVTTRRVPLRAGDRLLATDDALLAFYLHPALGSIEAAAAALTAALAGRTTGRLL